MLILRFRQHPVDAWNGSGSLNAPFFTAPNYMPRYDAVESMKSQSYVKSEGIYQEESDNENENRSNPYFSDLNNCHI